MARLTSIQVGDIKRLLDENGELPVEWRWVLFPPEKQEYELVYACKQREEEIIQQTMAVPLQPVRTFGNGPGAPKPGEWHNRLIFGDNLQAMKTLLNDSEIAGKVELVYIDPPFATQQEFRGSQDQKAYQDRVAGAEFVEFMRKRLVLIRELLASDGSVYIHLDQKKSHYIKVIADEVFGEGFFRNEIIWRNTNAHNKADYYGRVHQALLFYSKGPSPFFNKWRRPPFRKYIEQNFSPGPDGKFYAKADLTAPEIRTGESGKPWHGYNPTAQGRHWAIPGFVYELMDDDMSGLGLREKLDRLDANGHVYHPNKEGGQPRLLKPLDDDVGNYIMDLWAYQPYTQGAYADSDDCIDEDVSWSLSDDELADYPTQKPERLLARVIRSSSRQGGLVLDAFPGSGTTLAVAEKLGRRWIGIDCGKLAMYTTQRRMLNLRTEIGNAGPPLRVKPFTLYNAGHYDFSTLKDLPWPDWKFFALQLFECQSKPQRIGGLDVDGERAGAPVLVFNWRDKPHEKIGEATIEDIHRLVGKKVGRKFYIIAPMMAFDFFQDYVDIDKTRYYALKIPYSIIQELHSRDFTAVVQARDESNVNDIQEAYGFSFMIAPEVEFTASLKKRRGEMFESATLKTTKFVSRAKIRGSERQGGFETLAMLMVDTNYNGDVFNLGQAFYGNDLEASKWEASFAPEALGARVAAIWVDHHGNEFKAVIPREAFGLQAQEEPDSVADRPRQALRGSKRAAKER